MTKFKAVTCTGNYEIVSIEDDGRRFVVNYTCDYDGGRSGQAELIFNSAGQLSTAINDIYKISDAIAEDLLVKKYVILNEKEKEKIEINNKLWADMEPIQKTTIEISNRKMGMPADKSEGADKLMRGY